MSDERKVKGKKPLSHSYVLAQLKSPSPLAFSPTINNPTVNAVKKPFQFDTDPMDGLSENFLTENILEPIDDLEWDNFHFDNFTEDDAKHDSSAELEVISKHFEQQYNPGSKTDSSLPGSSLRYFENPENCLSEPEQEEQTPIDSEQENWLKDLKARGHDAQ